MTQEQQHDKAGRARALNYGEINKHAAVQPSMRAIRDFLEWLDEQRIELGTPSPYQLRGPRLDPITEGREAMLARFFEIDTVKLENERRALLKSCK